MMVNYVLALFFLGLHATQPLADELLYLRVLRIDIAHEDEGEISGVGKALMVDLERLVQRYLLQNGRVHDDGTRRMVGSHHLDGIGERDFGVLVAVHQLVA